MITLLTKYFCFFILDLLSVVAQQLDYLSNALRVLDSSGDNQYRIRGQPRFDKVLIYFPIFFYYDQYLIRCIDMF